LKSTQLVVPPSTACPPDYPPELRDFATPITLKEQTARSWEQLYRINGQGDFLKIPREYSTFFANGKFGSDLLQSHTVRDNLDFDYVKFESIHSWTRYFAGKIQGTTFTAEYEDCSKISSIYVDGHYISFTSTGWKKSSFKVVLGRDGN
jgi:hypothetical protein